MQAYATAPTLPHSSSATVCNGILVLSGYGVRLSVDRGHLVFSDGLFGQRRKGRLSRATAKLKRLVVLGHSGTITLDALRWIANVGASFVQIDADGRLVTCSAPAGLDDSRLRRAQALAAENGVGLSIMRQLVQDKMTGQARLVEQLPGGHRVRVEIFKAVESLDRARTAARIRNVEAAAANAYWSAWSMLEARFARRDQKRVPDHWKTFGSRTSLLTKSPRTAANPANAILNYLYAVLETETRIAVLTMGLDPGIGFLHADQRARDSLVLDLMETVRPRVDAYASSLLRERTFAARDFVETSTGNCRLAPPLPQLLAETAHQWRPFVAPVVERVAHALIRGTKTHIPGRLQIGDLSPGPKRDSSASAACLPTLLTQANRSAGRDDVRRKPKRALASTRDPLPPACAACGGPSPNRKRRYCHTCLPERQAEVVSAFAGSGTHSLARLRSEGCDPTHGGNAARKRGDRNAHHQREAAKWNAAHGQPSDPDEFGREILPGLQGISLSVMMRETALSRKYCWMIRRGDYVPHSRHWGALRKIANGG